jgi:hypothetical protein
LNFVKTGRDEEFLEIIAKLLEGKRGVEEH